MSISRLRQQSSAEATQVDQKRGTDAPREARGIQEGQADSRDPAQRERKVTELAKIDKLKTIQIADQQK